MSKYPTATRDDHDTFCTTERWTLVRGATGRPVDHHRTYKLSTPDGRVLRTRISKPVDRTDYSRGMWSKILREQLEVTGEQFWICVKDGLPPTREIPAKPRPGIPYYLLRELTRLGLTPEAAALLTEEQAKQTIADHWGEVAES